MEKMLEFSSKRMQIKRSKPGFIHSRHGSSSTDCSTGRWCGWCAQFEVPEVIQREDVIKTHRSEVFGFANSFVHSLCILHGILQQFDRYIML